jgi:hypothetical protein
MIALCCWCDTVSVAIPAGDDSARPDEGLPAPNSPAETARVLRERGAPNRLIHYDLDPKAGQGL